MEKDWSQEVGRVSAIYISRIKGQPREGITRGSFLENHGLEGDAWSSPGDRQVLMLTKKARLHVEEDVRKGLCYLRFKETLQIDGFPLENCPLGTRLSAGAALLEVSGKGKRCFPECVIVQSGSHCTLKDSAVFLRVIQGGEIAVGDPVNAIPRG